MNAVKYLKEKQRMCEKYIYCNGCPLSEKDNRANCPCNIFQKKYPEKAVAIVEQWSKDSPVKTYLSVLLEKFPKTLLKDSGIPRTCPKELFGIDDGRCPTSVYGTTKEVRDCIDCWNREYKEEA